MKVLRIICVILSLMSVLHAQTQTVPRETPQPLPSGTLLQLRAPDFSKWIVTCNPGKTGNTARARKFSSLITVTKTKTVLYEQTVDAQGRKNEKWCTGDLQYTILPGSAQRIAFDRGALLKGSLNQSCYTDYSVTDFPGVEWVSAKNYVDVVKYMGRDCLLFNDNLTLFSPEEIKEINKERASEHQAPLSPEECKVAVVAYVDFKTRLPVMQQRGEETRVYQFDAPPQAMLVLPADVQKDLERRGRERVQLSRMPSRPY